MTDTFTTTSGEGTPYELRADADGTVTMHEAAPIPPDPVVPVLPWHQRAQNRVRMAILNWLGVTPVLIELGRRNAGNRSDIETIAGNTQGMLTSLNACISATNRSTQIIGYWRANDLRLGKLAHELDAADARRASKVIANGNGAAPPIVLDSKGNVADPTEN